MPDAINTLEIPDPIIFLLLVGLVALAIINLGHLLRLLRVTWAIGKIVSWLAAIARDAFIEGARDAMVAVVHDETRAVLEEFKVSEGGLNGASMRSAIDRIEQTTTASQESAQRQEERLEEHIEESHADRQAIRLWLSGLDPDGVYRYGYRDRR